MSALIPWGRKKETALAPVEAPPPTSEIVIHQKNSLAPRATGAIQVRDKVVTIAGKKVKANPEQLIRLIKRVTQNIGEYKGSDDVYSHIICGALRKARADLVNVLESEFHVHWQVDEESGKSVFYM